METHKLVAKPRRLEMNNPFLTSDIWQSTCTEAWSISEHYSNLTRFFKIYKVDIFDIDMVKAYLDLLDQYYSADMLRLKRESDKRVEAHVDAFYHNSFPY